MRRAERRRAAKANSAARTLLETDFLLLVDDESRLGALRFQDHDGGPFLAPAGPTRIPPLVELPKLLSASERVIGETDTDEDLRLLLAPGSSLGGAGPKRRYVTGMVSLRWRSFRTRPTRSISSDGKPWR